jgi:hypothetical protein
LEKDFDIAWIYLLSSYALIDLSPAHPVHILEMEQITLENLEQVVKSIHSLNNVSHDEDSVLFTFHDKDGDDVHGYIQISDKQHEHLTAILTIAVSASHAVSALVASNAYNLRKDTFGTFSYANKVDDEKVVIVLESDIQASDESTVKNLIQDFIEHINLWESKVMESINEIGPDSKFMKGGLWDAFTTWLTED